MPLHTFGNFLYQHSYIIIFVHHLSWNRFSVRAKKIILVNLHQKPSCLLLIVTKHIRKRGVTTLILT